MAEDPTAPSLNLTPEEKRVFGQLFRQADTENIGVVTGEVAVKFFEKTRLEPSILGAIWQIADKENRGLLTPAGFGIVLRLIGHYQAGRYPTPELALEPGPLPKFEGAAPGASSTIQPPPGPPPSALQPQGSGGPIRVPPLTPDKAGQYAALFEKSGAQNGVLPGEQAKQIFERAGLPNEILGRIWNLADTEQRGALQVTEFVIAMHLLASFKSGALRALPNVLPAGLYEAAARRPPSRQSSTAMGSMAPLPRQLSGAAGAPRTGSPLARQPYAPPQFPQATGATGDWAITPADKAKFDGIYNNLDKGGRGYITGDEAVPFFSESKLPEEVLAQIWDLSDINSAGVLNKDEFAVAMYLIRQQRGKRDGRDSLPTTLPPNLIPPSMRNQPRPAPAPTAPDFDAPPPTLPKSAAEDLFGLDALSSPAPAPTQAPLSTGGSASLGANDAFGNKSPASPSSPTRNFPASSSVFKPFVPSTSFGQSLSYQATGGSNSAGPSQTNSQPSAADDLLGDNDPEISKKLTNETTELANLSNQVGTLSKQMQDVQGQRATSQNELSQASSQKQQFEQRLSQLRTLYEQEVKDVRALQDRLNISKNETKKLQTEIAMIEGTYQDLQNQRNQVTTALQADQQENASLKERMRAVNAEVTQLKPALEKLRSEARQQKGLVAINKKQLATNEAEREKLKAEAEELNKSIAEDTRTLEEAAKIPIPSSQVVSPAPSTMSANNPFFRRQGSTTESTSGFTSPPHTDRSFENVFGPAFSEASPPSQAAPPTSFRQDSGAQSPTVAPGSLSHSGSGSDFAPASTSSPATSSRELPQSNIVPPSSPPPQNTVPPPPPESRQISSSFLPFPDHSDSVTSSRQVSAPNSRFGEDSSGAQTPTNYMTPTGSSNAGPSDSTRAVSPGLDRHSTASPATSTTKESIPGAFPGEANSHIVATPTGGSTLSEQAAADPFALNTEPARAASAKDDFDSAFAGFGSTAKPMERSNTGSSAGGSAAAPTGFSKEFPPIAELDNDDDSDSDSERGGFDDDFSPPSPGHMRNKSSTALPPSEKSPSGDGANDLLAARPAITHNLTESSLATTGPPSPSAQASPPTYDKIVSPSDQAHTEVQAYKDLLPTREIPNSPPAASAEPSSSAAAGVTPFGTSQGPSHPAASTKASFGDDFDEFDDLEDAKEGDADDDFANISMNERSGMDDFNPVFDSPPASKAGPEPSSSNLANSTASAFSKMSFGEYTQSPQSTHPAPSTNATAGTEDWDAIFAGLDSPANAAAEAPATSLELPSSNGNGSASTSAIRPDIGRALTNTSTHDDPILKNLTGMGYPRQDALAALEKYDYNLERAANYLASQS